MKNSFLILLFVFVSTFTFAQDKPVTFTVDISTDSILMDNYFQVRFTVENADGQNFEAPDFSESFDIVSGPNFSTSVSMMNGDVTQSMNITYYLRPRDVGAYYIQPASVQAQGELLETMPMEVFVHPNPDGIQQSPPMQGGFQMEFGDPFGAGSPFNELFKGFDGQQMQPFGFEEFFKGFDSEGMPFDMEELFKGFGSEGMPFDMEQFFKEFEKGEMPFDMEELFKNFDQENMPEDMLKWFEQFDMEMPELEPVDPDDKTKPKKKRKTTRI